MVDKGSLHRKLGASVPLSAQSQDQWVIMTQHDLDRCIISHQSPPVSDVVGQEAAEDIKRARGSLEYARIAARTAYDTETWKDEIDGTPSSKEDGGVFNEETSKQMQDDMKVVTQDSLKRINGPLAEAHDEEMRSMEWDSIRAALRIDSDDEDRTEPGRRVRAASASRTQEAPNKKRWKNKNCNYFPPQLSFYSQDEIVEIVSDARGRAQDA